MLASISLLLLLAGLGGCEGAGEGQLSGTLFLRGCEGQGSTEPAGQPAGIPPFVLDPQFFAAEPSYSPLTLGVPDMRGINKLAIRLQRSPHKPERTDGVTIYLYDVDALMRRLGTPLPLTPPAVSGEEEPLPVGPPEGARVALNLFGSCPFARTQALLRGSITFTQLGYEVGDMIEASLSVVVEDARGLREQRPAADQDAAGQLAGWFRFPVQWGRASSTQ